jgi:hypothetical protein
VSSIDDLLKIMEKADDIMKQEDIKEIEKSIPYLIDLLDTYQNAHLSEAADKIVNYLISLDNLIVPHLNLAKQESNFINYFAFIFIPKCSEELILAMKNEVWNVINKNDLTEETDLHLIQALLKRRLFENELKQVLFSKKSYIEEEMKIGKRNKLILEEYLESLSKIKTLFDI